MMFTNFHTPWSGQNLKTIEIRYYDDINCQKNQRQRGLPAITIQPGSIPRDGVALRSFSEKHGLDQDPAKQVIGYKGNDNTLEIKFKPVTTTALQGRGMIEIKIPYWWKIGTQHAWMFSQGSTNQCQSLQMRVYASSVQFGSLKVFYQEMEPEYIKGKDIIISCKQFQNPIYPKLWGGDATKCEEQGCFIITTYDAENDPKPIEVSVPQSLDTTMYQHAEISQDQMKIQPSNLEIGNGSRWTFFIRVPIPMQTGCFIKMTYPQDLKFQYNSIQAQGFFQAEGTNDIISIDRSNNRQWNKDERTLIFNGCNNKNGLGEQPYGRLHIDAFFTPNQIKNSGEFKLAIYKDQDMKQLIAFSDKGGFLKAQDLLEGAITEMTVKALDVRVQALTPHRVTFVISHPISNNGRIVVKMPEKLTLGDINSTVKIVDKGGNIKAETGRIVSSNVIEIDEVFGKDGAMAITVPLKLDFEIHSSRNQPSTKDAGGFQITTMTQIDGKFYNVDKGKTETSFVATAGQLKPATATDSAGNDNTAESLLVSDPTTYSKEATWTLKFKAEHAIPTQGYVKVKLPSEIELLKDSTMSGGICSKWSCPRADIKSDELWILVPVEVPAGEETVIEIVGVLNPRTFKQTGTITITTYADKVSVIDEGFNVGTKMTIAGQIKQFSATPSNDVNGVLNTYKFSIMTQIPLKDNDTLSYKLPAEVGPPSQDKLNCKSVLGFEEIECSISGSIVEVKFKKLSETEGAFTWSIDNVRNPISTRPSKAFEEIKIQDKDNYQVAGYTEKEAYGIKNKQTAQIVKYKLAQANVRFNDVTNYTVKFTPVNAIPKTGSIQITWPLQVTVTTDFECKITTNKVHEDSTSMCTLNNGSRTLTIKGAFDEVDGFYGNEVTVEMVGIKNPSNNKPGNGFVIQTFEDNEQIYPMDSLKDFLMLPALQCEFPCKECDASGVGRKFCTECWPDFQSPYLMTTEGTCGPSCTPGFTSNGNPSKKCEKCDDSCVTCNDNGKPDDKKQCIDCNVDNGYPWRITETQLCVDYCHDSFYASGDTTCGKCKPPCKNCKGTESTCTSCDKNHKEKLSFLWKDECIFECPQGYTLVKDECKPCASPCSTCVETSDKCLTCDGTENTRFVSDFKCYENCPKGTVLSGNDEITCVDCQEQGCDLCEFTDLKSCLLCKKGLFQHEGKCLAVCPEGFKPNTLKTACQNGSYQDFGFIYFPFLIAFFIVCLITAFGYCKKKARIVKGRKELHSTQNGYVSVLALASPLQFFATVVQAVFCYWAGVYLHAIFVTVVLACFLILNTIFFCVYWQKYQNTYLPKDKQKLVREGKLNNAEAKKKFTVNSDNEFAIYAKRHKCFSLMITISSLLISFKLNKLYYSHFYSFSVFKARWTDVKFYRKMMMWFCIAHFITIDLFLICIDISGLSVIEWGNQLYITMIETLVLSLVGLVIGSIELYQLKDSLAYTEVQQKKGMFRVQGGMEDDMMDKDERAHMMKGLLAKVKKNQNLFLNNKLDELLDEFGERRCKSMIELPTGWPKEEDPRQIYTVPLTPKGRAAYDGDYKFTKDDAYDLFPDMCGAEAKTAKKFHETGMGADQGQREFIEAQMRKTGAVFNSIEDDDGKRKKKGARRGRKNKYITQIDAEDEEEAEAVSQSADEREEEAEAQRLAVIKEQEEHEEEMKRQMLINQERQNQEKITKKKKQELELKNQKENEDREYKERLAREADEEKKFKEEARIEKERLNKNDAARQALLDEEARDKAAKDKADADAKAKAEAEERKKREEYEAAQLALKQKQDADAAAALLAKEKADRERQAAEDAEKARLRKEVQDAQDARDEAERQKKLLQMNEADRIAAEAAEADRLRKKKEKEDKDAEEKRLLEEQDRLKREKEDADREAERLKKAEADRLRQSTDNKMKQMELDDAEAKRKQQELDDEAARKRKEEEDRILQDRLRQEALDKEKALLEQARKEPEEPADHNTSHIEMREAPLEDFADQPEPVNIPPFMNQRNFNECDILGDFDRDDKGNIIVLQDDEGNIQDKDGNPTNERGYLMDQSGNILDNHRKRKMFDKNDMDDRGEVPAPYCVEKHNFNPHDIMGDLDFQEDLSADATSKAKGKPGSKGASRKGNKAAPSSSGPLVPHLLQTNQGFFVDKKGQRINKHGWMTSGPSGNLVDKFGRKKFDKRQLQSDGDFPKLFSYSGKRFDIKDLMGVFNKDGNHKIMLIQSKDGKNFEDNNGRLVNEKGYLIDRNGNIIDAENKKVWWLLKHLKHGEFPKIFPYTKFNIKNIQGDFDLDPLGNPILDKDGSGNNVDRQGRRVNGRGYLIDTEGQIIDKRGKLYFDLATQDVEGEIPAVFRTGLLKSDTASSLSRLMSEIVRNQSSDFDQEEQAMEQAIEEMKRGENGSGDTSVDSMMGDTPANYNVANQRFEQGDDDEIDEIHEEEEESARGGTGTRKRRIHDPLSPEGDMQLRKIRKKKKKKPKKKIEDPDKFLKPTYRDFQMAGVYGGDAHVQKARPGIKYDRERVIPGNIPKNTAVPVPREFTQPGLGQLAPLANHVAGFDAHRQGSINDSLNDAMSAGRTNTANKTNYRNTEERHGTNTHTQQEKIAMIRRKKAKKARKIGMKDGDFEKMFGENIDQFLEDSEWDVDSFDKMSRTSGQTAQSHKNEMKLKAMEKNYLSNLEKQKSSQPQAPNHITQSQKKMPKARKPAPREFQDRFVDDPDYIRRGQQWDFEIDKKKSVEHSSGKQNHSPLRGPQGNNYVGK